MGGAEVARLLKGACDDAGLDEETTVQVLLAFTIRWGMQLGAQLDLAMYEDELRSP